jgi:pullulanase
MQTIAQQNKKGVTKLYCKGKRLISLLMTIMMVISIFFSFPSAIPVYATDEAIVVDGQKDTAWNNMTPLGSSSNGGWGSFHIGNFYLTNDSDYLYFWVDAVNVPNWGETGMFIDIALNINDKDSGVSGNPWEAPFNFNGTSAKPQYHITFRIKNDNEVNGAALYSSEDLGTPILSTWGDSKGAEFAVDRTKGFEGKIPLTLLGLKNGDSIKAIVVLSGNNSAEHGAFDVIPEAEGNEIADSWEEVGDNANIQSTYSEPYIITGIPEPAQLEVVSTNPVDGQLDVDINLDRIDISFNESITLLSAENITVTDAVYNVVYSDSTLTIDLEAPLEYDREYTVNIPEGTVKGVNTNTLNKPITLTFTTETDPNTLPELPEILSPTFNVDGTATVYTVSENDEAYINGNFVDWKEFKPLTLEGTYQQEGNKVNLFSYTFTIDNINSAGGVVQYKFSPVPRWEGDYTDPLNNSPKIGSNSAIHYLEIESDTTQAQIGGTLNLKAVRYLADGTKVDLTNDVTWSSDNEKVSVDNGIITVSNDATVDTKVNISAVYNGVTASKELTIVEQIIESPVVENNQVTFNYIGDDTTQSVLVAGSFNGWATSGDNVIEMTKGENNLWSVTVEIPSGIYSYKFVVNGNQWILDPLNNNTIQGGYGPDNKLVVPGILLNLPTEVELGDTVSLSAKLLTEDEQEIDITPTWSLKESKEGVTLEGNTLTITDDAPVNEKITVIAAYEGYAAEHEFTILGKMYTYTINYYRYDREQMNWDMWIWIDGKEGAEYDFTEQTPEGFARGTYKFASNRINLITRPGDWSEQEMDRVIEVPEGQNSVEVWIIQGDQNVYYDREDVDISQRVLAAMMDSLSEIYVTTTHDIDDSQLDSFRLVDATNGNVELSVSVQRIDTRKIKLTVENPHEIDVRNIYMVESENFSAGKVTMRNILSDSKFFYDEDDLGLTFTPSASTFKVWAPTATKVSVALYDDAGAYNENGEVTDHTGGREIEMTRDESGVWSLTVNENLEGKYYMYKVEFADGTVNYAVDPYARAVSANGQRTAIVDLEKTGPANWNPTYKPPMVNPTDAVIYEVHVRDFSIDENSGMTYKGKFKAFAETGTTYNGIKTGIDSLEELGVTHVHLLPSYDFKTVNELKVDDPNSEEPKFNWGYDPQNYNVPEGSYSTDPTNPTARITEFKEMVEALHQKGIRVIMDVVYNHTYEIENGPFNKIVPGYFYRTDDTGRFTNGSGCGNEIASERPMVRKYIKDSVKYWAREYNIDGFRFDLMGLIDIDTMEQITNELHQEIDPTILIYGEPWTGGSTPLSPSLMTTKGQQKDKDFAVFNDNFRNAIRSAGGNLNGKDLGFATGAAGVEDRIVTGVRGSIDDFTNSPTETINYTTSHDNLNLWDDIMADLDNSLNETSDPYEIITEGNVLDNEVVRRSLLANGIVFTSQGIPFIQGGDEFLRSKYGDHNSYKSPDEINKFRWELKERFKPVFDYYRGLINLRKAHPAFRMTTKEDIESNIEIIKQEGNVVAFKLKDYANGDTWRNIIVIYNANEGEAEVTLPEDSDTWNVVVDETMAGADVIRTITGNTVTVPPISMMVLYDEANDYIPEVTSIELDIDIIGIEVGESRTVKAVVKDQRGNPILSETIVWNSSDEAIATVSNGKITGISEGTAIITARVGEVTSQVTVHVGELIPTDITISGESSVFERMSVQLKAEVYDQYGQKILNPEILWTSSDTDIATVDSTGKVTGVSAGVVTITAEVGNISTSIDITVKEYVQRIIRLKYVRPDGDYTDWNLWVWGTGTEDVDQVDFDEITEEGAIANIKVAPGVTQVGFIVRKGTDWSTAKQDIPDDRYIQLHPDQILTKVTVISMVKEIHIVPYVEGPEIENGSVTFYYRDEELYMNDAMDTIEGVKVKIDGTQYDMEYIEEDELFKYTLENITEGVHEYTFLVTKNGETVEIPDPKNVNEEGKSLIVYEVLELDIKGNVEPNVIDYNQNAVLSLNITDDGKPIKAKEIYVDLAELGGSEKVFVDPELNEITIAVKDTVTAGVKTIPIKVIDEYGKEHFGEAQVEVKSRIFTGNLDFDWDEARIYFIMTDRFNDGDSSNNDPYGIGYDVNIPGTYHGGDFKGITEKLNYLKNLGINTIWITPIVENIKFDTNYLNPEEDPYYAYHGYWASNFEELNKHFGNLEDFHKLIDEAHKRGIKIMVDVVINHAGYGLKENDPGIGKGIPFFPTDEDRERFKGMFRTDPVDGDEIKGELAGLPDFRTEDPEVRNKIISWQVAWVEEYGKTEKGNTIDYFRVDTVKHVDDTTWMAFKNTLTKVKPDFKLIGETYGAGPTNTMGDLGKGKMDSLLDFHFNDSAVNFVNGNLDDVESYLEERNQLMDNTKTFGHFLGSHDEDGFLERVDYDLGKLKVAASLQMTAKGQPVIYYGEELGLSGTANWPEYSNRYDMAWDKVENNEVLKHYKKIVNARKQYSKVMSKGTRTKLAGGDSEGYIVFEREYNGESVIVALNVTDEAKEITMDVPFTQGTKLVDEYSNLKYRVDNDNTVTLTIPSMDDGGTVILALDKTKPSNTKKDKDDKEEKETEQGKATVTKDEEGNITVTLEIDTDKVEDQIEKEESDKVKINGVVEEDTNQVTVSMEEELVSKVNESGKKLSINTGDAVIEIEPDSFDIEEGTKVNLKVSKLNESETKELATKVESEEYNPAGNILDLELTIVKDNEESKAQFKKPVVVVINYDKSKVKDIRKLGAYYYNEEEGKWEYVGGKADSEGKLTFTVEHFSKYTAMEYNRTFADIDIPWAKDAIEVLAARHVIDGVDKDHYAPNNNISRAAFAKLIVNALNLKLGDNGVTFTDIEEGQWYAEPVNIAASLGIVTGYDGKFNPNGEITREAMATMIVRALKYVAPEKDYTEVTTTFDDKEQVADWAKEAVGIAYNKGIVNGVNKTTFAPKDNATRAHAAVMIYRMLEVLDLL